MDFLVVMELVDIFGCGILLLNGCELMDEICCEYFECVGEVDIKLMELGYLLLLCGWWCMNLEGFLFCGVNMLLVLFVGILL